MNTVKTPVLVGLLIGCMLSTAWSAETRTWTDNKGRTLSGKLVKVEGDSAIITLENGNQVTLKRNILSARDNEYLSEYGGVSSAIVMDGKVGTPEKDARIDTKTFVKPDNPFIFPNTEIDFDILQSEHFLVMTDGNIRPKNICETAERLWHGMAFQHPGFRDKWGDKRRAIFVVQEEENHRLIGEYYKNYLVEAGQDDNAMLLGITWPKSSGSTIALTKEAAEEHGLFEAARVFKVDPEREGSYKKVFTPFVTHCLAGDMFTTQAGGTTGFGGKGYFALVTGHSYYKEIQLGEKSETSLLSAQYDSFDTNSARGFADGTSWAKELKKMVRKGDAVPSVEAAYGYTRETLAPTELVLLYSLSHYMQSTPQRLAAYAKMIERIDTSKQVPEPVELARLFGFETVEEFEKDWTTYVESSSFKD
jgi:hypothetical protein